VQQAPQRGRQSMKPMLSPPWAQAMHDAGVSRENANKNHSCWSAAMSKSATFGVMHLGIAFGVSYALTGSVSIAGAITVVEPLVNTVAHYFFDRWWSAREMARSALAAQQTQAAVPALAS
jgi:uncharacterized membrane protein